MRPQAGLGSRYEVSAGVRPHLLGGALAPALALEVRLRGEDKIDEALDFLWKAAAEAHRGIENDQAFRAEKTRRVGTITLGMEGLGDRTNAFGDYAQFDPSGRFFGGELDRARALTGDEVRAIVKRTLAPDKALVVVVKPRAGQGLYRRAGAGGGGSDRPELPVDRSEAAAPIALPATADPLAATRRFELGNGLKVALLPTQAPLPILTASVVFGVGTAHEPPGQAGIAHVAAEAMEPPIGQERGETSSMDGFAELGIESEARVTADTTTFTVRGLNLYQELMLGGLERMIKTASYGAEQLERMGDDQELREKRRSVRAQEAAARRLAEALYGAAHPYARTAGAPHARLGYDTVRAFAQKHYVAENATLVVAGRFDEAVVEAAIRKSFEEWERGQSDLPITAPPAARTGARYLGVDGEEAPLVQVRLAFPTPAAGSGGAEHAARLILAQMLTQRVEAVREKLGASYGVYARYARRLGPSSIEIGGGLDAARAAEALGLIRAEVDGLRRGEHFLEDFVLARRRVVEALLVASNDSQSLAGALAELAAYRLPPAALDELRRAAASALPPAVLKLVNADLRPDNEVIVAVGPRAQVQAMFAGAKLDGVSYEK
jgi:zinc protease